MKIHIFIEHNITLRHFINNAAFEELLNSGHDVCLIVPSEYHSRLSVEPGSISTSFQVQVINPERERVLLWKRLFLVDKYAWSLSKDKVNLRRTHAEFMGWKGNIFLTLCGAPVIRFFVKRYLKRKIFDLGECKVCSYLAHDKPDIVLHPSVLSSIYFDDLIEACKEKSIPLIAIMNSWDNPSTKHGAVGSADKLLVWGQQTKEHAVKYMHMRPEDVVSFGAAQFDVYYQQPMDSRNEFKSRHELEADVPVLLYAGSSKGTSEIKHLDYLDKLIEDGELPAMKILYRPHPWGNGGAGGEDILTRRWRNVKIESTMVEYLQGVARGEKDITLPDYVFTHNVLSNVDIVVSPLSTIIVEAALHGKPALCFLPLEEEASHFKVAKNLPHFVELFEMEIFPKAYKLEELAQGVRRLLELHDENCIEEKLREAARYFVEPFNEPWAKRIVSYVEEVAAEYSSKHDS